MTRHHRPSRVAAIVVLVVVITATAVAACGASGSSGSAGSAVPSLKGATLTGGTFDLASAQGMPTVVNFFASWCGPCNQEAPEVVAFAAAHPGVRVIGVATNDKPADTRAFAAKYGITYPVVLDTNGAIGSAWGVTGIPMTFFIDKAGTVRASILGSSTQAQFEAKLSSIR